ncbi:hypothetical protein CTI12_AA029500 [Artemisia annua]|uniref:Uncharacterized protein n=1 Tax=Artemisia annua TaxID=35608 RepID=A0A2U1QD93_ARTAN|nr:hypothetical protein CTI12_AA029500 [Artemisia annua]
MKRQGRKNSLNVKGAMKFALKAQNLFPGLEGISQLLAVLDVHVAAENKATKKKTVSQKDETNGTAKTVPTSVPSSSNEQIAPETSKVKGSRKKNKVDGTTKVGPTSAPASSNEQIVPETTPGSCLTEVKTCQEKDKVNGTTKTGPTSIALPATKQMTPKMFWTVCNHEMQTAV